jgi:hypothetical protein
VKRFKLDPDAILKAATKRSGLGAYLDEGIAERFHYFVGLCNDFASIPAADFHGAVEQVESVVVKRLMVARDWAEHPDILESEIKAPLLVIGNARAGTTFTQAILEMDEGNRTPRYRDVQHPSPPRGVDTAADAEAVAEQDRYVDFMVGRSPRMMPAHPYLDQRGESEAEDEYSYSLDFHIAYPLWYLKVPSLPQALPPRDPVLALQFFKNMLKQYQWKTPTKRWVGKGVIHQYIMPSVLEVFPDSVSFWIHRPPEEYIASLLELLEQQYQPFNGDLYPVKPGPMVEQLKAGVDHILNCPSTNDPRIHHIRFHDFVRDPASVIAPIYESRGIPFTNAFAEKIRARHNDPAFKADRYGKFEYSLESFGLNRTALRKTFAEYCDRFDI